MERKQQKLDPEPVVILYKNYKGRTDYRKIKPIEIYYGTTKYHREPGWLLKATDLDKDEIRDYAVGQILEWGHQVMPAAQLALKKELTIEDARHNINFLVQTCKLGTDYSDPEFLSLISRSWDLIREHLNAQKLMMALKGIEIWVMPVASLADKARVGHRLIPTCRDCGQSIESLNKTCQAASPDWQDLKLAKEALRDMALDFAQVLRKEMPAQDYIKLSGDDSEVPMDDAELIEYYLEKNNGS